MACRNLEAKGVVQRFCKSGRELETHGISNVWSVGLPYVLLYFAAFRLLWPRLSKGMIVDLNPLHIWVFIW